MIELFSNVTFIFAIVPSAFTKYRRFHLFWNLCDFNHVAAFYVSFINRFFFSFVQTYSIHWFFVFRT